MAVQSSAPERGAERFGPTTGKNRIVALDVLRGFALLGILVVNIMSFSGVLALDREATGLIDRAVETFISYGARGVFMSTFAMLFGIGFAMQMARIGEGAGTDLWTYGRRLLILLMFGLLHRLLDPGEVLVTYAICGGLLLLFRKVPSRSVLLLALILMPLPFLHTAIVTSQASAEIVAEEEAADDPDFSWDPHRGAESIAVHSEGDFSDVLTYNVRFTIDRLSASWVNYIWITVPLPLMLFGMLIGRLRILATLDASTPLIRRAFWMGLGGALLGRSAGWTLFSMAAGQGWNPWIGFAAEVSWVLGAYSLAVGYGAGMLLLLQKKVWRHALLPLRTVGRLALSNYLLQTVICTTLFYRYGVGLFGEVRPAQGMLLALGIFLCQVAVSAAWLRSYRFGPVEWLWRRISYWRVLPNKKPA